MKLSAIVRGVERGFSFKAHPLTSTANLALLSMSIYAAVDWISTGSMWSNMINGYPHYSSIITFSLFFISISIKLRFREKNDLRLFSASLASLIGVIWLYELIYFLSFIDTRNPVAWLLDKYNAYDVFWKASLASLWLITAPYWRLQRNLKFIIAFSAFTLTYATWLAIGFPQNLQYWNGRWTFFPFRLDAYLLNAISKASLFLSAYLLIVEKPFKANKMIS